MDPVPADDIRRIFEALEDTIPTREEALQLLADLISGANDQPFYSQELVRGLFQNYFPIEWKWR